MDLSILKLRFFPKFLETDAPTFIDFFQTFLAWFSLDGNPYSDIDSLSLNKDIDTAVDQYMLMLQHELMVDFPVEYVSDLRWVMHNLTRLYQTKGTENSFKIFFKMAFNSICKISYPRESMLRVSAGNWVTGCYVHLKNTTVKTMLSYVGRQVKNATTNDTGIISDAVPHYFTSTPDTFDYALVVTNYNTMFSVDDDVIIYDIDVDDVTATIDKVDAANTSGGYWSGTDGLLDSDKVLQDSNYYQMFSYVLETGVLVNDYGRIVDKILHPAGWKRFSIYNTKYKANDDGTEAGIYAKRKPSLAFIRWLLTILLSESLYSENRHLRGFAQRYLVTSNSNVDGTFQGFVNHDWYRKYGKIHYGYVDSYQSKTAYDFDCEIDESSKLVFGNDGKLLEPDFPNCLNASANWKYSVFAIVNNAPRLKLVIKSNSNGYYVEHEYIGKYGIPLAFYDGCHVTVTKNGNLLYISNATQDYVGKYLTCYSIDSGYVAASGNIDDVSETYSSLGGNPSVLAFNGDGKLVQFEDADENSTCYVFKPNQMVKSMAYDNTPNEVKLLRYPQKNHHNQIGCIRHDEARLEDRTLMHVVDEITRESLKQNFNRDTYMLFGDNGMLLDPFESESLDLARYCVVLNTYHPTTKFTVDVDNKIEVGMVSRKISDYNDIDVIERWKDTVVRDMVMYTASMMVFVDGYKLNESLLHRNNLMPEYVFLGTSSDEYGYYAKYAIVYFIDTDESQWDNNEYIYNHGDIEVGDALTVSNVNSFLPFINRRAACHRVKYGNDNIAKAMVDGTYESYEFNDYTNARVKYVV